MTAHVVSPFTRALTALCQEHGVAIHGGYVAEIDMTWSGPDAEKWEQYAIDSDGALLLRGFWNQAPTSETTRTILPPSCA
jgi:hypothetical protein